MHALKFNTTIDSRRRLELDLPLDTPEGTAEVIILVPEPSTRMANDSLRVLFERLVAQPLQQSYTREEVDAFLA